MTKKLKRGVGRSSDRFVMLPHYLIKSQAWRTMPALAKALLLEVWVRYNGANNGEISFSGTMATTPIPEPSTILLYGTGLGLLALLLRSNSKRQRPEAQV